MIVFRDGIRQDRVLLQAFRCTTPPPLQADGTRAIGRAWEAEVEAMVHDLKPPGRREQLCRLGFDSDEDLCSVVVGEPVRRPQGPLPEFFIKYFAISLKHRYADHSTADAAMSDCLDSISSKLRLQPGDAALVMGKVHHKNRASRRMAERNGMVLRSEPADLYGLWAVEIEA